jgi:hypothetical protein
MEILWIILIAITTIIYTVSKHNNILKPFLYAWLFLVAMSVSIFLLLDNISISTLPTKERVQQLLQESNNKQVISLQITDTIQENGRYIIDVSYYLDDKSCESKLYLIRQQNGWIGSEREKYCKSVTRL